MKNNKFSPPPLQNPKIPEKTVAEYVAMSEAEHAAMRESPNFQRYYSRYEEMNRQHAEQEKEQRAQEAQRIKDKKQARIHDFHVAAFGSAFALLLEHLSDIVHFIQRLF